MNDLINNEIAEQMRIHLTKEILKLADTSRYCIRFVPVYLIDISQTKNRLPRRETFMKIIRKNEQIWIHTI